MNNDMPEGPTLDLIKPRFAGEKHPVDPDIEEFFAAHGHELDYQLSTEKTEVRFMKSAGLLEALKHANSFTPEQWEEYISAWIPVADEESDYMQYVNVVDPRRIADRVAKRAWLRKIVIDILAKRCKAEQHVPQLPVGVAMSNIAYRKRLRRFFLEDKDIDAVLEYAKNDPEMKALFRAVLENYSNSFHEEERYDAVIEDIQTIQKEDPKKRILLDIGSSYGMGLLHFRHIENLGIIALDRTPLEYLKPFLIPEDLAQLSEITRINADAMSIPLADGTVDFITILYVLYHMDEGGRKLALQEAKRALADGGRMYIAPVTDPEIKTAADLRLMVVEKRDNKLRLAGYRGMQVEHVADES